MVTSGSLAAPLSPGRLCFDSPPGALKTPRSPRFTLSSLLFQKLSLDPIQVMCASASQLLWLGRGFLRLARPGHMAIPSLTPPAPLSQ